MPDGFRIRWGEFDPDRQMPPSLLVAWARGVRDRSAVAVAMLMFFGALARALAVERCAAGAAGLRGGLRRLVRRRVAGPRTAPKRISLVVLLQRNMLHLELKLAGS